MILAPIGSAMFMVGGTTVMWAWMVAGCLTVGGAFQYLSGNSPFPSRVAMWLTPFMLFLAVAFSALMTSPYRGAAMGKGIVQLTGIAMMLVLVLVLSTLVRDRPIFIRNMLYLTCVILGLVGAIAIFQFIVNNLARAPLVNFMILRLINGDIAWRPPGMLGPLFRANSIEPEPAHLTTYLTMVSGLAFLRLGGLGHSRVSELVRAVMPRWAAICIVGGFAVSLSLVGYIGFALALGAVWAIWIAANWRSGSTTIYRRQRRRMTFVMFGVLLLVVMAVPLFAGQNLTDKLASISLIFDNPGSAAGDGEGTWSNQTVGEAVASNTELVNNTDTNLSALALAVNTNVMISNLRSRPLLGAGIGGHPVSYDENLPSYAEIVPSLKGLNRDDAAALGIRLLSETGVIGTITFVFAGLWVGYIGFRATRHAISLGYDTVAPIMAALSGSWLAVFILYLLRFGLYYNPAFWTSIAFVLVGAQMIPVPRTLRSRPAPVPLVQPAAAFYHSG
jgi:hypothetical protein